MVGLTNLRTRVIDAQDPDLGSDSSDAAIRRFGPMGASDPPKALAEAYRALTRRMPPPLCGR